MGKVTRGCSALSLGVLLVIGCKTRKPRTKQERAKAALARVASIEPDLVKVRGLEFERAVPASYQTAADFRSVVHRAVEKDAKKVRDRRDALVALGLLPRSIDLGRAIEDSHATQAAAYYDPDAKRFFLVVVPDSDATLDLTSAHELTHALQDQHFDLTRYLRDSGNSDARAARKFVVEGDAMLASIMYTVFAKTRISTLTPRQVAAMRTALEKFADLDPAGMAAMLRKQASVSSHMDPELKKSLDAMDKIPRTILVPLLDSYMKGAVLALDAYGRGGWRAVDALYRDPPESTEQVLHPEERLLEERDHPRRVTLPKLGAYTLVATDVLGELQWSVYFSLWKHERVGPESLSWGGDRYAVVRTRDGKLVALVATIWDTEYDAKLFFDAYVSTLKARYGGEPSADGARVLVKHGDDSTWVVRIARRVYIVDGGQNDQLIDTLVNGTTFE